MDKKICRFYIKEHCKLGKNCKFIHENNYDNKNLLHKNNNSNIKNSFSINMTNKYIQQLNFKRIENGINTLEISFVKYLDDKLFLFFTNRNFALVYDLNNNSFEEEQLILNKNIKKGIYFIYQEVFGTWGDCISLAYNYYNEYKMERQSCICVKNIKNLYDDSNDLIINISNEQPLNHFFNNEKILAISFNSNTPKKNKVIIYLIDDLKFTNSGEYNEKLKKKKKNEFEFEEEVELLFNFKNLLFN